MQRGTVQYNPVQYSTTQYKPVHTGTPQYRSNFCSGGRTEDDGRTRKANQALWKQRMRQSQPNSQTAKQPNSRARLPFHALARPALPVLARPSSAADPFVALTAPPHLASAHEACLPTPLTTLLGTRSLHHVERFVKAMWTAFGWQCRRLPESHLFHRRRQESSLCTLLPPQGARRRDPDPRPTELCHGCRGHQQGCGMYRGLIMAR